MFFQAEEPTGLVLQFSNNSDRATIPFSVQDSRADDLKLNRGTIKATEYDSKLGRVTGMEEETYSLPKIAVNSSHRGQISTPLKRKT